MRSSGHGRLGMRSLDGSENFPLWTGERVHDHDGRSEAAEIACLTTRTIRTAKPQGKTATFSINATRDVSIDGDVASLTIPTDYR